MLRDANLNFGASCARHDISDVLLGSACKSAHERVSGIRDRIQELKLLDERHAGMAPIDRALVAQVRALVRGVSVADAARAVAAHAPDVEAACAAVRQELGISADAEQEEEPPQRSLSEDPLLRELQRRLKVRNAAPALNTIAAAVDLCRDEGLDPVAACVRYCIPCDRSSKGQIDRITAVRDRIVELNLLEAAANGEGEPSANGDEGGASWSAPRALPLHDIGCGSVSFRWKFDSST